MMLDQKSIFSERRRLPRHERNLSLLLFDAVGKDLLDERPAMQNISEGGVGFTTAQQFKIGDTFQFHVEFPGPIAVRGTGRIRWANSDAMGLTYCCGAEIMSLNRRDRRTLQSRLRPASINVRTVLDSGLTVGCCAVAYCIAQDMGMLQLGCVLRFYEWVVMYLPFLTIVAGAVVALYLYFRAH